jgi:hypothetical protein
MTTHVAKTTISWPPHAAKPPEHDPSIIHDYPISGETWFRQSARQSVDIVVNVYLLIHGRLWYVL